MQRSRFIRGAASMAAVMAAFPLVGCGGGGSGDAGSPAPAPGPAAPPPAANVRTFAYVPNYSSGDISVFRVDADGALKPVGAVLAEFGASSLVVHPSGRFAYVLYEEGQSYISVYRIDPLTGMLNFGMNVEFAAEALELRVHPTGRFAYVRVPGAESVVACTVDTDTGALVNPVQFALGGFPRGIDIESAGNYLYMAMDDSVSAYSIAPASGSLTLHSTVATEHGTASIRAAIAGNAVYVVRGRVTFEEIISYPIERDSHRLLPAEHQDDFLEVPAITLDPLGRFLYAAAANFDGMVIQGYAIDEATGDLTRAGTTSHAAARFNHVAVGPSGKFAYATDVEGGVVHAYEIDQSSGVLREIFEPVQTGDEPSSISIADIGG